MLMSASPGRGGDGAGADRAQRATGSSTTDRKICSTVSGSVNRLSCPHARARGAAPIPTSSDADRPAPAGWAVAAAAGRRRHFFLAEFVVRRFGGRRWSSGSAPMLMSASPGRGGDGAGADRAQRATGSSTTDRKICSTVSGALSRALSALRPLRLGKISGIWQR